MTGKAWIQVAATRDRKSGLDPGAWGSTDPASGPHSIWGFPISKTLSHGSYLPNTLSSR